MVSWGSGRVFQSGTTDGRDFRISEIPDKTDDPAENGRVWLLVSIYRDLAKKVIKTTKPIVMPAPVTVIYWSKNCCVTILPPFAKVNALPESRIALGHL